MLTEDRTMEERGDTNAGYAAPAISFQPLELSFQPIQFAPIAATAEASPSPAIATEKAVPESLSSSAEVAHGCDIVENESSYAAAPPETAADASAEPAGLMGKVKSKTAELAEHERVKQGITLIKDTATAVAQHEKVQQSVDFVKRKTAEVSESERFQKGIEKTKEAIEVAKEKTKGLQEKAGNVWQAGRGSISRVRANVSNLSWRGSARDTLDIAAREEEWRGIKVQGAEEMSIPARTEHTCCYHVSRGSTLRWTFRVKDNDLGFGVRMRVQAFGGSREEEVLPIERYDSAETISGSWVADEDRTIVLAFDNRFSKLRSKTVAYYTGIERAAVCTDTIHVEPAVAA
jgi:hypothetical protein